ncbi:mechanosensitive ion channel family protein [Clostridium fungisolvens]|uniref:Small-conductance mechanosensitive channel n=1 Tax=Clostridium fungisolvens TaxID=1604897 RepID=A0A6V8SM55_9CLOT|nr:mechanosensitive ion channel family protein [Clostridium fungisolvens]GFP78257.1 Small-conductance mechanosensitive channel [Clostridium fungisolvens]
MSAMDTLFSIDYDKGTLNLANMAIKFEVINNILWKTFTIIVIIFIMYISIRIGNAIIDKFVRKQIESEHRFTMDEKKASTIGELLKSILKYTVYFFGIVGILSGLFNGISLTFASIGGVAVGFGAQSIVKDLINGVFILFEDQYAVSEYVTIGSFSGIVESIGIRTTQLRDFSGDIHLIPNGTISTVTNHSRGNMRVMLEIEIDYEENVDRAIDTINQVCDTYSRDNNDLIDKPQVVGVTSLSQTGIVIRVSGSAKPMMQWAVERDLRKAIKIEFDRRGIKIPHLNVQNVVTNKLREQQ